MTDPATITGWPSEVARLTAIRSLRDVRVGESGAAAVPRILAAAYAVDEPRIRADQTRRIAAWLEGLSRWPGRTFLIAELEREFGSSS